MPSPDTPAVADPPRYRGLKLGTVLGAPVVLAWSWFIAAIVIVVIFTPWVSGYGVSVPLSVAVAFGYAVLLFISVFLHELAHAISAKVYGHDIVAIELNVWGGYTHFSAESSRSHGSPAVRSLVISVVGPLTNLFLALAGWLILHGTAPGSVTWLLLFAITFANLALGVINLLPGLPLDGGRALEAGIWAATRRRHLATIIAAWSGQVIAILAVVVILGSSMVRGARPSVFTVLWAGLIGYFLFTAAHEELKGARMRAQIEQFDLSRVVIPAVAVRQDAVVTDVLALEARVASGSAAVVVFDESSQPWALVNAAAVRAVAEPLRPGTPVSSCSQLIGEWLVVHADIGAPDVVAALSQQPGTEHVFFVRDNVVTGYLDVQHLYAALVNRPAARRTL